jgi:hypothetical protein
LNVDPNVQIALAQGRHVTSLLREVIALRRGAGRLAPEEYFYYRLWDANLPMAEKRRFVGKHAQHPMHLACNNPRWYGPAAHKILFQTIMTGEGLPLPELLAITQTGRHVRGGLTLTDQPTVAAFLRQKEIYPLFAKPAAGKYSLSALSADAYDPAKDEVILLGGERREVDLLAASLFGGAGYLLQRRLSPRRQLKTHFGPRLCSLRVLVLLAGGEPVIHRVAAKIATSHNPADNYWRPGNMLGAVDLETGQITRSVRGTGADLVVNEHHPDTDKPAIGTAIPEWDRLLRLVK